METTLASTTMDGTTILHMTRSFGSHAKSEFDKSLSCGFDMPSDSVRHPAVQPADHAAAQGNQRHPAAAPAAVRLATPNLLSVLLSGGVSE